MAKSKQHRRKLYEVENTPVKETPRYDGDGTEWIFESPDGGKTIYKRAMGSNKKYLVNQSKQLELFPEEEHEDERSEEWKVEQYNRNRPVDEHIEDSEEINKKQEWGVWPDLDDINRWTI